VTLPEVVATFVIARAITKKSGPMRTRMIP
jgi:hypothetical protein